MQQKKILIVEDNTALRLLVAQSISEELHMDVLSAATMAEAMSIIANYRDDIFVTVLDLNLPDAPNGEIVDAVLKEKLPVIVLTASMNTESRNMIAAKPIIDYVIKKNMSEISYLVTVIDRVWRNQDTHALVVDDDPMTCEYLKLLLQIQNFQIFTANSAEEGLAILAEHPEIKLVISDYLMPGMDGEEFILKIREQFSREQLGIISISSHNDQNISAKLLKCGASDYISRPFLNEEFFCRIGNTIDAVRNFEKIRDSAIRDHLTGMYNRKYLFEAGGNLYDNAVRDNMSIAVAMLDIDHFKKINDSWGHQVGDLALKHVADLLDEQLRSSDLLVRMGGEEFCVIATRMERGTADMVFNRIRTKLELTPLVVNDETVNITISIGISLSLHGSLEQMINAADAALYTAKENGRNRVVIADDTVADTDAAAS